MQLTPCNKSFNLWTSRKLHKTWYLSFKSRLLEASQISWKTCSNSEKSNTGTTYPHTVVYKTYKYTALHYSELASCLECDPSCLNSITLPVSLIFIQIPQKFTMTASLSSVWKVTKKRWPFGYSFQSIHSSALNNHYSSPQAGLSWVL